MKRKKNKNKGGRPKVESRNARKHRVSIAINVTEKQVLENRIRKSGLQKAEYLRQAIFNGEIKEALTPEDAYLIRQLYKLGQLLALLFKQGRLNKDVDASEKFAWAIGLLNEIEEYYLTKISKK